MKLLFISLAMFLVLQPANAGHDGTPPKILSLSFALDKNISGEIIQLIVEAEDKGSGLRDNPVTGDSFSAASLNGTHSLKHDPSVANESSKIDDTHVLLTRRINEWQRPGIYKITSFTIYDNADNAIRVVYKDGFENYFDYYTNEELNLPVVYFSVHPDKENYRPDLIPPQVLDAKLNKNTFKSGETIALIIEATDDNSGLYDSSVLGIVFFNAIEVTESEYPRELGDSASFVPRYEMIDGSHVVLKRAVPHYSARAKYRITKFYIMDNEDNLTRLLYKEGEKNYFVEKTDNETNIPIIEFNIVSDDK